MKPWLIYIRERFPLPVYFLLSGGLALSGAVVGSTTDGHTVASFETLMCFVYAMWVFATLRLMDELKDYDKDVIAHPTRPLPRGVLTTAQVSKSISVMMTIGWLLSACFVLINMTSMWLSTLTTAWLWLMYKEFYIGQALAKRPLLYAITHQIILVPFCLLMASTIDNITVGWSLAVLGSFFTYEVSRKLDPGAHPILGTYLSVYRRQGTFMIVAMLFAVSLIGAKSIGFINWMGPWAVLTLLSYSLLWLRPTAFKVIEGLATVSLFFHIWSPVLNQLVGRYL